MGGIAEQTRERERERESVQYIGRIQVLSVVPKLS